MIIRTAIIEDLPILLDFEQKIIEAERPMDPTLIQDKKISYYSVKDYILSDHTEVVVAEIEGEIVGSGYGQIRDRKNFFKQKQLGYIGFMYVKDQHRGKGVSQKIIKYLCDWFASKNLEEIRLTVYDQNPRAIRAYEKVGFKKHLIEMRVNLSDLD
ncbi:ribosomal protein S18 acetylase RimI-like enzyme [Aquimarina sp. EL_43]|uniref:GNAT family N-acetyltransferase n=1 Tax=unclassified Aquimarina TaxID=2627091 RepID=UPI0018CA2546|nr:MULTISPECIES: GNAT family N-acetyltransferase [unclassified Aquimarina]MBG6131237.1 ribosomal protein S18 acetylase RimI-like enzyme [Aquimarina sp. EL_35]MBG6151881.1 ribosomal protein S18 acetylase RimI-like enzyme [Aquimarina sp. EL_32]MBG6169811.1 ribosomal protein S18 acetylase RimI-like enzyme [Aquimarina sp. EL_43]